MKVDGTGPMEILSHPGAPGKPLKSPRPEGDASSCTAAGDRTLLDGAGEEPCRDWTVLIYSSLTRDIDGEGMESLKDLEKAGSDDSVAVAIQLSRNSPPGVGGWRGARRLFVQGNGGEGNPPSQVLQDLGSVDMSDPRCLSDFVEWGMKRYPARHYAVVIGGHGGGFIGAVTDLDRSRMMPLPGMEQALKAAGEGAGKKIDVLALNSCLMGQVESAVQLQGAAEWVVASEKPEYGSGMPLGEFVERVRTESAGGPVDGCRAAGILMEASSLTPGLTPAVGAIDTKALPGLTASLDALAGRLLETDTPLDVIKSIIGKSCPAFVPAGDNPPFTDYRDVHDFAALLFASGEVNDPALKEAAKDVALQTEKAVAAFASAPYSSLPPVEKKSLEDGGIGPESYRDGYRGLSIYLPTEDLHNFGDFVHQAVTGRYSELTFARATRWPRVISMLTGAEENPRS